MSLNVGQHNFLSLFCPASLLTSEILFIDHSITYFFILISMEMETNDYAHEFEIRRVSIEFWLDALFCMRTNWFLCCWCFFLVLLNLLYIEKSFYSGRKIQCSHFYYRGQIRENRRIDLDHFIGAMKKEWTHEMLLNQIDMHSMRAHNILCGNRLHQVNFLNLETERRAYVENSF